MKPLAHFCKHKWFGNLQAAAVNLIDDVETQGCCCQTICALLQKIHCFISFTNCCKAIIDCLKPTNACYETRNIFV